jgi:hypothetical protein
MVAGRERDGTLRASAMSRCSAWTMAGAPAAWLLEDQHIRKVRESRTVMALVVARHDGERARGRDKHADAP